MKLYADSADLAAVRPLLHADLVHGVTSNPTILARSGLGQQDLPRLYQDFAEAGAGEIFMQAVGASRADLQRAADLVAGLGQAIVVKVPATADGFHVARRLVREGARVLLTAVYSLPQAVFAASIGASYVAPYFGRIIDSGEDGLAKVSGMNSILEGTETRVLVASVRSPSAAATLALHGVRHITADVPVLARMMLDPVTESTAEEFERTAARHGSAPTPSA